MKTSQEFTLKRMEFVLLVLLPMMLLLTLGAAMGAGQVVLAETAEAAYGSAALEAVKSTEPEEETAVLASNLNCRYGVTPLQENQYSWIETLRAGWHLNFAIEPRGVAAAGSEFVPVIRVKQDRDANGGYLSSYSFYPPLTNNGLGQIIDNNPGQLWLVGNEPDVIAVQDDTYPAVYARAYHDAYHFIKQRDPSAQVGVAGLSMMTPGRLQYLTIMYDTYSAEYGTAMPVDVWNFHLYILSEIRPWDGGDGDGKVALGTDPALAKKAATNQDPALCPQEDVYCRAEHDSMVIFEQQVINIRTWMRDRGLQEKPLILSEFSLLYPFVDYDDDTNPTVCFLMDEEGNCFTADRVNTFMDAAFAYLENAKNPALGMPQDDYRLVQQWMWFALWIDPYETGGSSRLLRDNYPSFAPGSTNGLSSMGMNFYNHVTALPTAVNLKAGSAANVVAYSSGGVADVTLSVDFYNNGNTSITQPFQVTFYRDQALTQPIGSTTVTPADYLYGCARRTYTAQVDWNGVSPGLRTYWVKIDTGSAVSESSESDNVVSGKVYVDPAAQLYLPAVNRD